MKNSVFIGYEVFYGHFITRKSLPYLEGFQIGILFRQHRNFNNSNKYPMNGSYWFY